MDTTAQNIAIAEFCGWTQIENKNTMAPFGMWFGYPPSRPIIGRKERLPEYTSDLNAMHDAVLWLRNHDGGDYLRYQQQLIKIDGVLYTDATAAQRAKALLRVIGKWTDKK